MRLHAALAAARIYLDDGRKNLEGGSLEIAAASALLAIGELLAGIAGHLTEQE